MSQMNTSGVNVVNAAGDPAQNAATTGANQRAKAELAVREQELKLEQAKIKVQKYGIDTQSQDYAKLNQSRLQEAQMHIDAAVQQQQQQFAQQQARDQQQREFLNAQEKRQLQRSVIQQKARIASMRGALRGMGPAEAELDAQEPVLEEQFAKLQAATVAHQTADKDLQSLWKQAAGQRQVIMAEAAHADSLGEQAARNATSNFWRSMSKGGTGDRKTNPFYRPTTPQESEAIATGASVGGGFVNPNDFYKGKSPEEFAEAVMMQMAADAAPVVSLSSDAAPKVQKAMQDLVKLHMDKARSLAPHADGTQNTDVPAEIQDKIKAKMRELMTIQDGQGKNAVSPYSVTSFLEHLDDWAFLTEADAQKTSDQIVNDQTLMQKLGWGDEDKKYFRTLWEDPQQRQTLIKAMPYIKTLRKSVDVGDGVMHRPQHLASFYDALTDAIADRRPDLAAQFQDQTLDPVEQELLTKIKSRYDRVVRGLNDSEATIKDTGVQVAHGGARMESTRRRQEVSAKQAQLDAEEQSLKEYEGLLQPGGDDEY